MLEEIFKGYKKDRKNLILILQDIQNSLGYISTENMLRLADFLGIAASDVFGAVTFYKRFRSKPQGLYPVTVCLGTACHLAGGQLILEAFERELNIKTGEVAEDKVFGLDHAACFGCCTKAPVVDIKGDLYPRMSPGKVEEVLVNLKDEISST